MLDSSPLQVRTILLYTRDSTHEIDFHKTGITKRARAFFLSSPNEFHGPYIHRFVLSFNKTFLNVSLMAFQHYFQCTKVFESRDSFQEHQRSKVHDLKAFLDHEYSYSSDNTPDMYYLTTSDSIKTERVENTVESQVEPVVFSVRNDKNVTLFPNLRNMHLINYLKEYTFTPSKEAYEAFFKMRGDHTRSSNVETQVKQASNHQKLLDKHGSTQISLKCHGGDALKIGDPVRLALFAVLKKGRHVQEQNRPFVAEDNDRYNPEGSVAWTQTAYKVVHIEKPDDVYKVHRYRVEGKNRLFFRHEICPLYNIEKGAIVRINLYANDIYRQHMANEVKRSTRHFKYNHTFSRALFKVDVIEEDEDGTKRYYLKLVWDPRSVFRFSAWEVKDGSTSGFLPTGAVARIMERERVPDPNDPDKTKISRPGGISDREGYKEVENLWAFKHKGMSLALTGTSVKASPFRGFKVTDLLRVDKQTERLMQTDEGKVKYEECLRKCLSFGRRKPDVLPSQEPVFKTDLQGYGSASTRKDNCGLRKMMRIGLLSLDDIS